MSIRTKRWITCEEIDCIAEFEGDGDHMGGETGADIRLRARRAGWRRTTAVGTQIDLCPKHAGNRYVR